MIETDLQLLQNPISLKGKVARRRCVFASVAVFNGILLLPFPPPLIPDTSSCPE